MKGEMYSLDKGNVAARRNGAIRCGYCPSYIYVYIYTYVRICEALKLKYVFVIYYICSGLIHVIRCSVIILFLYGNTVPYILFVIIGVQFSSGWNHAESPTCAPEG